MDLDLGSLFGDGTFDFGDTGGGASSWLGGTGDNWWSSSTGDDIFDFGWAANGSSGGSEFLGKDWLGGLIEGVPNFEESGSGFLGGLGNMISDPKNIFTIAGLGKDIYSMFNNNGENKDIGAIGKAAQNQMSNYLAQSELMGDMLKSYIPLFKSNMATELELAPTYAEGKKGLIRKLLEGESDLVTRYADQASGDVAAAFSKQRDMDTRRMYTAGLDPSGRQGGDYLRQMGVAEALGNASARTMASRQAEETALSRQAQALNFQRGVPLPNYQMSGDSGFGNALSAAGANAGASQDTYKGIGYGLNKLFGGV